MSHLLPKEMFQIKKMYKGRNPSPEGGQVELDYRSSFNGKLPQLENAIARLQAVKKKVPFADLNFIREALDKSLKVTTALRGKIQQPDQCPEVVSESISYNHESTLANCGSEENSKHKEVLNDLKSLRMSDNFKTLPYLKLNSEKIYDNREDDLEATFHRNKVLEIKENIFDGSSLDHSSTRFLENSNLLQSRSKERSKPRDKVSRKKYRDSSHSSDNSEYSYRKRSFKRNERRRFRESGSRSRSKERSKSRDRVSRKKHRESSHSSDNSEYSYRKRSFKKNERRRFKKSVSRSISKERSKSRDRVTRKKHRESSHSSDNSEYSYKKRANKKKGQSKCSESTYGVGAKPELPSDTHSDSNASFKATPKSQKEDISKLSTEYFGNESQSASEVMREDSPRSQPTSNQFKLSPRSEQNDNSLPYDEEYVARQFVGAETYYCRVCQKNLNGITCYESHMKGKNHKKAEAALRLSETMSSHKVVRNIKKEPLVKPELLASVPDGKMFKSFETALYQEKIDAHRDDPIPGLEFVDEIHYQDDGTIAYNCNLCSAPCVQTSIFGHLIGAKHCLKFLQKVNPHVYERIRHKPKHELQKKLRNFLETHEKQHGRKQITVKVVLKKPKPSPFDAADGSYPMEEENRFNSADYLDESGNYFCSLCEAPMNNENMLYSHLVGKRHLKNVKKTSSAIVPSTPNSSSKKTKAPNAPSKLERMLENYDESPIVGLNFIRETQNVNGEIYHCSICKASPSLDIIDHITSMKHQIKYLETVDANKTIPNAIQSIRVLEVFDPTRSGLVADVCREIEIKHGRGRVEVYR